jgi:HSP20 family protein
MALALRRKERQPDALARIHDEMDELFGDFLQNWDLPFVSRGQWPVLDIAENENEFIVKAEVPGCKAEDIDISVDKNRLTISGEKKQEEEQKSKNYYHLERSYGSFRREINLGCDVDANKIDATYKDGILNIRLPKTEKTKPVKVKIKNQ